MIQNVNQLFTINGQVYTATSNEVKSRLLNSSNTLVRIEDGETVLGGDFYYFQPYINGVVYNTAEGEELWFWTPDRAPQKLLADGFYFNWLDERTSREYLMLSRMKEDFSLQFYYFDPEQELLPIPSHFFGVQSNKTYWLDGQTVKTYDILTCQQMDLTRLRDVPHQSQKPFLVDDAIVVAYQDGSIEQLNRLNGKSNWQIPGGSQNIYPSHDSTSNSLYYFYGTGLSVHDFATGEPLVNCDWATLNEKGITPTGPIWSTQDFVIVADTAHGYIALLHPKSLRIIEFFHLDGLRIPPNKYSVALDANYLYVHASDYSVRRFDISGLTKTTADEGGLT